MNRFARTALIVFLLSLFGKGIGFLRDMVLVARMGVGAQTDLYYSIINLIEALVVFSGLSTLHSLSNVITAKHLHDKPAIRNRFYTSFLLFALTAGIMFMMLPLVFPKRCLLFVLPGYQPEWIERAASWLFWAAPSVVFLALFRIFHAQFGVHGKFFYQNIFLVIVNAVLLMVTLTASPNSLVPSLCLFFSLAYGAAVVGQYLMLRSMDVRLTGIPISIYKEDSVMYIKLVLPLLMVTAAQSIAGIVDRMIASYYPEGMITALSLASGLFGFVVNLLLISITSVLFPDFSKAHFSGGSIQLIEKYLSGLKAALIVLLPIVIFILFFHDEIIRGLYFRRKFSLGSAEQVSGFLKLYALAIIPCAFYMIPSYVLQSMQCNTRVGFYGAISFIFNIVASIILSRLWGPAGIVWGTILTMTIYSIFMLRT